MKHVRIKGNKHPEWTFEHTFAVAGDRRHSVMHIAKAAPAYKETACDAYRGTARSIDLQPDFDYTICGDCIERAVLKVDGGK